MTELITKKDLLEKLGVYSLTPDDEGIQYKAKIKKTFMGCPELLYALNNKKFESELFTDNGDINWDPQTHEPHGEWELYFGDNSNIRPFLYFPETQDLVMNYLCYQVNFDELARYNDRLKYTQITFTIFVNGKNAIDKETDIPRHDLIASIIRERFNWSNIFGMQTHIISSKESLTDNNFITKTLVFQLVDTNGLVNTPHGGKPSMNNYQLRR